MNPKRSPLDATADSVQGAIALLWDWLGAGPRPDIIRQDVQEHEVRIPPIVVDTEGEDA